MLILNEIEKETSQMKKFLLLATIVFISLDSPAHAYLDPGATSIVLQWLVGGIAVGATAVSFFYQRVKDFFSSLIKAKK